MGKSLYSQLAVDNLCKKYRSYAGKIFKKDDLIVLYNNSVDKLYNIIVKFDEQHNAFTIRKYFTMPNIYLEMIKNNKIIEIKEGK